MASSFELCILTACHGLQVGTDLLGGSSLVKRLLSDCREVVGGDALCALLGEPDAGTMHAEVVDVTPRCEQAPGEEQGDDTAPEDDRRLALVGPSVWLVCASTAMF